MNLHVELWKNLLIAHTLHPPPPPPRQQPVWRGGDRDGGGGVTHTQTCCCARLYTVCTQQWRCLLVTDCCASSSLPLTHTHWEPQQSSRPVLLWTSQGTNTKVRGSIFDKSGEQVILCTWRCYSSFKFQHWFSFWQLKNEASLPNSLLHGKFKSGLHKYILRSCKRLANIERRKT